jgi:hypothetical protein
MAAARETHVSEAMSLVEGPPGVATHRRRVVAVAVSAMELLRPESDLARLIGSFEHADLLLAADDGAVDTAEDEDERDEGSDVIGDVVRAKVARLGHGALHLHRLGLRPPGVARAEVDLVAAMSELVGFDPEPGVYCLAPALSLRDPARVALNRAAQRIAQVYGIPLLRYRCLELSVVGDD